MTEQHVILGSPGEYRNSANVVIAENGFINGKRLPAKICSKTRIFFEEIRIFLIFVL